MVAESDKMSLEELLSDGADLGSARGGRKLSAPLSARIVRPLDEADLPLLLAPPPVEAPLQRIKRLTNAHHALARSLARGLSTTEAALASGYSISYVSMISNQDPTFRELVAYYARETEEIFVDSLERMKAVGLAATEILAERLEEDPEGFSNRELLEVQETNLVKPLRALAERPAQGAGGGSAAGVTVNVQFVNPEAPRSAPLVDAEVVDVESSE